MFVGQAVTWINGSERHYGVIVDDPFSCCDGDEEPVHPFNDCYQGLFTGMEVSDLVDKPFLFWNQLVNELRMIYELFFSTYDIDNINSIT